MILVKATGLSGRADQHLLRSLAVGLVAIWLLHESLSLQHPVTDSALWGGKEVPDSLWFLDDSLNWAKSCGSFHPSPGAAPFLRLILTKKKARCVTRPGCGRWQEPWCVGAWKSETDKELAMNCKLALGRAHLEGWGLVAQLVFKGNRGPQSIWLWLSHHPDDGWREEHVTLPSLSALPAKKHWAAVGDPRSP